MPPVSQQGSRAGLITSLVLSIVVAIVFIITTIYFNSQFQQKDKALSEVKAKYAPIVADDKLTAEGEFAPGTVDKLKTAMNVTGPATLTDLLQQRTDAVIKRYVGAAAGYDEALKAGDDAITAAMQKAPEVKLAPTDPLTTAVVKLADAVKTSRTSEAKLKDDLKTINGRIDVQLKDWKEQLAKLDEQAKAADERAKKAEDDKAAAEAKYVEMQGKSDTDSKKAAEDAAKMVQDAITAKQASEAQRDKAISDLGIIKSKLRQWRMDTKSHMIAAAPDGEVVRLGGGSVCYINLGSADHLPPGLTFEVYDRAQGIPVSKTDTLSDNNLPVGKASIEVVRIGQNSSECRVIHTTPGQTISQGDIIVNLVYDHNTSYHFFVYGDFDVDQNGVFSAQEGDVIKSLVTRWGGKVDDKINIQTDFIILGREPKVPALTQDEMNDPLLIQKKVKAEADLKAWQDIVTQGGDLSIPIMNQNRFLYYVGYYEQAKR